MKKIVKEINIYKFDELKEDTQNKIIKDFKEILINDNFDMLSENFNYILKDNYKLYNFEINYSLSYCQGDGVCFYNNKYNLLSYEVLKNKDTKNANIFEKYIIENDLINDELLQYLENGYNLGIFKRNSNYSYAATCFIDYEYYYNDDEKEAINKYIDSLVNILYKLYINICEELEKIGYSNYNVSDQEVKEYISDQEFEFLENGEIYEG